MVQLHFPSNPVEAVIYLVGLVILWVIVSIPVYFAGRAVTGQKSTLGRAMWTTLAGGLVYFIVYAIVAFFLDAVIGASANAFAIVLAVLAWLGVYKSIFETTWLKAVAIVLLSWVILIILDLITVHVFGVKFPDFFPFV